MNENKYSNSGNKHSNKYSNNTNANGNNAIGNNTNSNTNSNKDLFDTHRAHCISSLKISYEINITHKHLCSRIKELRQSAVLSEEFQYIKALRDNSYYYMITLPGAIALCRRLKETPIIDAYIKKLELRVDENLKKIPAPVIPPTPPASSTPGANDRHRWLDDRLSDSLLHWEACRRLLEDMSEYRGKGIIKCFCNKKFRAYRIADPGELITNNNDSSKIHRSLSKVSESLILKRKMLESLNVAADDFISYDVFKRFQEQTREEFIEYLYLEQLYLYLQGKSKH